MNTLFSSANKTIANKESTKKVHSWHGSKSAPIWILLFVFLTFLSGMSYSEDERSKLRLSIKITYGKNYHFWGDINECLKSFNNNERFEYVRSEFPELITGEIIKLGNIAPDWEAELRMDISRTFALSLGTSSSIHQKNESSLIFIDRHAIGDQISSFSFKPEAKIFMPVRFGINYTLTCTPKLNIIFDTGIGYYSAKISEHIRSEITTPDGESGWTTFYWETDPKGTIGLHSGIGLEYSLIKKFAIVIEITARYAKIKSLKGIMGIESQYVPYRIEKGNLYFFNWWDLLLGTRYNFMMVWEEPPFVSIYDIVSIRKAVLDLTGFSLRAGIRIKLF